MMALQAGAAVIPVWNKSNREHGIVGSEPSAVRAAADQAVRELGWQRPYHVDADHITLRTVDRFVPACDFYTLDVADAIGQPVGAAHLDGFLARHRELAGRIPVSGIDGDMVISPRALRDIAQRYLHPVREAGRIYRYVEERRRERGFIPEISMDETDVPQTPAELLVILAAIADEGIPIQTIAPKFVGRFNKGVDYVGDVAEFEACFRGDLAVVAYAIRHYALPANLKLSVHSGSDKFSIYGPMRRAIRDFAAGIHLKTAGTSWLEELIGLAEAGGDGLALAQEIYAEAWSHREALCAPYASVIDIDADRLPAPDEVQAWTPEQYVSALRHDRSNPAVNPDLRQLLHVGYKIAAQMGRRYLDALERYEEPISRNVTLNLWERHIVPLFLGD
jgi:tagaturonate epimerase